MDERKIVAASGLPSDVTKLILDFSDLYDTHQKKQVLEKGIVEGYRAWMAHRYNPGLRDTEYQMKQSIWFYISHNRLLCDWVQWGDLLFYLKKSSRPDAKK